MKRGMLFVLCLILILPATTALAKKQKKKAKKLGPVVTVTVAGNTATTAGQESIATATCPANKQAVGGGFSSPLVEGSALIVHSSYRSAVNAWTVEGQVADGSGAVSAHAYCRNASAGRVTDMTAATTLSTTGETKTLTASCPAGSRLIGGGFQSTVPPAGDAVVFPQENFKISPTTWRLTGVQNQDGAITLIAHAYCLAKIAVPTLVVGSGSGSGGTFAPASATTIANCPRPKKPKKGRKKRKKKPAQLLSAGGFYALPVNGVVGMPVLVFGESRLSDRSWLASGVNAVGSPGSFTATSQGSCF
jgi:hypothetical protein